MELGWRLRNICTGYGKLFRIYNLVENTIKLSVYEAHIDIKIEVTWLRPGYFEIDDITKKTDYLLKYATKGSKLRFKEHLKNVVDIFQGQGVMLPVYL